MMECDELLSPLRKYAYTNSACYGNYFSKSIQFGLDNYVKKILNATNDFIEQLIALKNKANTCAYDKNKLAIDLSCANEVNLVKCIKVWTMILR